VLALQNEPVVHPLQPAHCAAHDGSLVVEHPAHAVVPHAFVVHMAMHAGAEHPVVAEQADI
jgi:hypothetical protein